LPALIFQSQGVNRKNKFPKNLFFAGRYPALAYIVMFAFAAMAR